jgi:RNA polymerase sigma-70 factor (sigma-E family)
VSAREGVLGERSLAGVSDTAVAMANLFDAEYSRLRGLAYVLVGDSHAAEEIVMEAFVKAFASWSRMRHLEWPAGYLRKIVINLCRGLIRRQRIEYRVNALLELRKEPRSNEWEARQSDARLDLWAAVRSLPERQRSCVVLHYLEDLTDSEVAHILGCSVGTVKTHMFRARASLERMLGGHLEEVRT